MVSGRCRAGRADTRTGTEPTGWIARPLSLRASVRVRIRVRVRVRGRVRVRATELGYFRFHLRLHQWLIRVAISMWNLHPSIPLHLL